MSRVLLITGAGRGIGAATARIAASRGYAVGVNYRTNAAAAEAVVRDIRDAGGTAEAIQGDVAIEADIQRMFDESDRRLGPLDAFVNNAGVVDMKARFEDVTAARLQRMFAINVIGAMLCAQAAVRRLSTAHCGRGGAIVNVSRVDSIIVSIC